MDTEVQPFFEDRVKECERRISLLETELISRKTVPKSHLKPAIQLFCALFSLLGFVGIGINRGILGLAIIGLLLFASFGIGAAQSWEEWKYSSKRIIRTKAKGITS